MSYTVTATELANARYPPSYPIPLQVIYEECEEYHQGTSSPEPGNNNEGATNACTPRSESTSMSPNSSHSIEGTSSDSTPPTTNTTTPKTPQAKPAEFKLDPTSSEFIPSDYIPRPAELTIADEGYMAFLAHGVALANHCIATWQGHNMWLQGEINVLKESMMMVSVIGVRKRLNPAVEEFVPSMERMCPLSGFSEKRLDNLRGRIVVLEGAGERLRRELECLVALKEIQAFP